MLMLKIMPCALQQILQILRERLNDKLLKNCSAVFAMGFKGAVAKTENGHEI